MKVKTLVAVSILLISLSSVITAAPASAKTLVHPYCTSKLVAYADKDGYVNHVKYTLDASLYSDGCGNYYTIGIVYTASGFPSGYKMGATTEGTNDESCLASIRSSITQCTTPGTQRNGFIVFGTSLYNGVTLVDSVTGTY